MEKRYIIILDYTSGSTIIRSYTGDETDVEELFSELLNDNTHWMTVDDLNIDMQL